MILWSTIKAETVAVILALSGLPAPQVYWRDEAEGSTWKADPTISLRVISLSHQGIEEERWDDDGSVTVCGQRRFTLSMRCEAFTQDITDARHPLNVLEAVSVRWMRETTRAMITSFAVEDRMPATFISYRQSGRQVGCYVMDWRCRTVDNDTNTATGAGDYINEVIADGEVHEATDAAATVTDHLDVTGA